MKQVININFHGQVVPIEVTAFDILKAYTESLNTYFANEEGKEEIINDIESRIGELFQERLKTGATCITNDDINAIIKSMGRPEEFEPGESSSASTGQAHTTNSNDGAQNQYSYNASGQKRLYRNENSKVIGGVCSGLANYLGIDAVVVRVIFILLIGALFIPYLVLWVAVPSSASVVIGSARKKLFRDTDDKIIGGVCSGIANYFGVNAWVPRILFLLPFLSFVSRWGNWSHWGNFPDFFRIGFSPTALIIYIILWLVIPEATTTSEKLEMKGEKVDMNTIKNSVMEEMRGMQGKAQKFGTEAKAFAEEKANVLKTEMAPIVKRGGRSFGDLIVLLFKIFAYFILGCIGLAFVAALFGLAIAAIGLFPAKDYLLAQGWQNVLAWGTLIFFIAVPIIGIITWIIRRLARINTNRKQMRVGFISLWLLGVVCFVTLITSAMRDFRTSSSVREEQVELINPGVQKLEITTLSPRINYHRRQWLRFEPFAALNEDTAWVRNVKIEIVKSLNDSFKVTMVRMADGRNRRAADMIAQKIDFNVYQADSLLVLEKGIAINKFDKFRNQQVMITIYVPVGKQIMVNDNVGWGNEVHFGSSWENDWNLDMDHLERGWDRNVLYTMRQDGLYDADGDPADGYKKGNVRSKKGIQVIDGKTKVRINENGIEVETDNDYRYETERHEKALDSLSKVRNAEQERLRDSLQKAKDKAEEALRKLEGATASVQNTADNGQYILPVYNPMMYILSR